MAQLPVLSPQAKPGIPRVSLASILSAMLEGPITEAKHSRYRVKIYSSNDECPPRKLLDYSPEIFGSPENWYRSYNSEVDGFDDEYDQAYDGYVQSTYRSNTSFLIANRPSDDSDLATDGSSDPDGMHYQTKTPFEFDTRCESVTRPFQLKHPTNRFEPRLTQSTKVCIISSPLYEDVIMMIYFHGLMEVRISAACPWETRAPPQ